MMYLLDLCLIIFVGFNLLYALRLKPFEYIRLFIVYLAPILILFFSMKPIYHFLIKDGIPSFMIKIFKTHVSVIYYYLIKIGLYLAFFFILKLISKFTFDKIIKKQEKLSNKWQLRLINLPLALCFSFVWSFWLVFVLTRLGVPYVNSISYQIYSPTKSVSEVATLIDLNEKAKAFDELNNLESYLKGEKILFINEKVDSIYHYLEEEINDLKTLLSSQSLSLFSGDLVVDLLYFTGKDNHAQEIYQNEVLNDNLRLIKKKISLLDSYHLFVNAIKTTRDENTFASGYDIIITLSETEISSNRRIKNELEELVICAQTQKNIQLYTKEYFELDELTNDFITDLFYDYPRYQIFLHQLIIDFKTLNIDSELLQKVVSLSYTNDFSKTLKEAYFKDQLLTPSSNSFFYNKGLGIIYPLIDDYLTSSNPNLTFFLIEQIKDEYFLINPDHSIENYHDWVNHLPISLSNRTKLIS